jgi:hypothetical protein
MRQPDFVASHLTQFRTCAVRKGTASRFETQLLFVPNTRFSDDGSCPLSRRAAVAIARGCAFFPLDDKSRSSRSNGRLATGHPDAGIRDDTRIEVDSWTHRRTCPRSNIAELSWFGSMCRRRALCAHTRSFHHHLAAPRSSKRGATKQDNFASQSRSVKAVKRASRKSSRKKPPLATVTPARQNELQRE